MPGALDRQRKLALMPRACADFAPGPDLAALGQISAQRIAILVVDVLVGIGAKRADATDRRSIAPRAPAPPFPVASLSATLGARPHRSMTDPGEFATLSGGRVGRSLIFHFVSEYLLKSSHEIVVSRQRAVIQIEMAVSDVLSFRRVVE